MNSLQQPLTNVQLELLKVFSHKLAEHDLLELKRLLAAFFAERLVAIANQTWDKKGWTDADVDRMLDTKMRASRYKNQQR